jgi:hypothetical protein
VSCGGGVDDACNLHGKCMSMAELARYHTNNGDSDPQEYGSDPNSVDTWDANRIHGCLCDGGYDGYDCSLRTCPSGDDPGTYDDAPEVCLARVRVLCVMHTYCAWH